jgi:hypothetical protein
MYADRWLASLVSFPASMRNSLKLSGAAITGRPKLWDRDPQILPSTSCYELMPQGVDGLRKFSTIAIRRFVATKKTI